MYVYKVLNFQYFAHLMQTTHSLEKSLMVRKSEGRKSRGHQRMRWLDRIIDAMDMNSGKLWQIVRCRFDPWVRRSPGKENGWEDPLEKGKATHSSVLD